MDSTGSEDHPRVQTAAGRAVGGGPPLSAMAMVSATASSLPPPPPSASDAAVRPRARDVSSDGSDDPPRSNATRSARERPSGNEGNCLAASSDGSEALDEVPLPTATVNIDAVLPHLTSYAAAADDDNDDAPVPPGQICADFERMDAAIKELSKTPLNVKDMPVHPSQMAADFADVEKDGDWSPIVEQEETIQQAQDPPTPADAQAPSLLAMDQGQNRSSPRSQPQIPIRPPPQSMMPSPDEDPSTPSVQVLTLPSDPSVSTPMLDAILVEDQPEPEMPVYDAVQVVEQTRLEKNKKIIIGLGMGLLIGLAAAAGVSARSNSGSSDSNNTELEGVVLSTARPSESSSPSEVPSLRLTIGPSRSLTPSTSLRPTATSRPSQIPSPRPSSMPTLSPPLYCGEINILTDEYFNETSWRIRNVVTINGIAYPNEVVLEESPEESGRHRYEACLEKGDYEFAIFDSGGDGISSPGYYSVTFDAATIARGGGFEAEETVPFSLPLPSLRPSESSSPSESPSPSFWPSISSSPSEIPSSSLRPSLLPSSPPSTYWSSLNWSRQGTGFNGRATYDHFGEAIAFSADALTMAIGAPGYVTPVINYFNDRSGYVKVFHREGEGSSWEQRGDTIHGESNGDKFGESLSLSDDGSILSIGAPRHDYVGRDSGQVKVYKWYEAALDYVQMGDALYGAASGKQFGHSLDISNSKILAVGAPYSDAGGRTSGQVTVYAWDEASSNFRQQGEAINGDTAGDFFGGSVSFAGSGRKLAVGSGSSGQVRVFEWDEATSNHVQLGDSLLGGTVSFSRDGTTLAVGDSSNSENGRASGQVKVFAWNETALNFEQFGQSLYGKAANDRFGRSVMLSESKTLAVGAFLQSYVEVYRWHEADSEYKRLGKSLGGESPDDQFGGALALSTNGSVLVVGAPRNDRNGTRSGRVEVFDINVT